MKYSWIIGAALSVAPSIFSLTAHAEDVKGLTVLINFGDAGNTSTCSPTPSDPTPKARKTKFSEADQIKLYNLINTLDYSPANASESVGSLRDYYLDNSGGKFNLTSDVVVVDLDAIPENERCKFTTGQDLLDRTIFSDLRKVVGLSGGPMHSLIKKALCKLGETSLNTNCTTSSYKLIEREPTLGTLKPIPKNTPYSFSSLTTDTLLYSADWLDRNHIQGLSFESNSAQVTGPFLLKTYKFIQFIVPTTGYGNNTADNAWGQFSSGLWPRSLPFVEASQNSNAPGLGGIPIGRTQLIPIDPNQANLGIMAHESGHTLFGFKDLYDTQQLPLKTEAYYGDLNDLNNLHTETSDPYFIAKHPLAKGKTLSILNSPDSIKVTSPQWYESKGVAESSLMGENGRDNPPLIDAMHREKAGWETPIDLYNAKVGDEYTLDWQASGSDPKTARAFKYCKPNSTVSECFYIEPRVTGTNGEFRDKNSKRKLFSQLQGTDVSGMLIWHAEKYEDIFDYNVNQRKEGTPGLHFDVSLVEADGRKDLMQARSSTISNPQAKLFGAPGSAPSSQSFGETTSAAKSTWWNKTESGFVINNIRIVGKQVKFKIGKNLVNRPVYVDFDSNRFDVLLVGKEGPAGVVPVTPAEVVTPGAAKLLPPGNVKLQITPKVATQSYRVATDKISALNSTLLTGTKTLLVPNGSFDASVIKIFSNTFTSYPFKSIKFMMDQGANVTYFSPDLSKTLPIAPHEYLNSGTSTFASKNCYSGTCEPITFIVSAKPGFKVIGWEVIYNDGSISSGSDPQIKIDSLKIAQIKLVRAKAERSVNLCAADIEPWRWDGEYSEVGTLVSVRNNSEGRKLIYSSTLPRATDYVNREVFYRLGLTNIEDLTNAKVNASYPNDQLANPSFTYGDSPWTLEMRCDLADDKKEAAPLFPADCGQNAVPRWTPFGNYPANGITKVRHNRFIWTMRSDYLARSYLSFSGGTMPGIPQLGGNIPAGLIPPGVHTELWLGAPLEFEETVGDLIKTYPLGTAWIYHFAYNRDERSYFDPTVPVSNYRGLPTMWRMTDVCPATP